MNLQALAIKNYQFTITSFVVMLIMGMVAIFTMPISEDPIMDIPTIGVTIIYPGASSLTMESQVVQPMESSLNELENLKTIGFEIKEGSAFGLVDFDLSADPKEKANEVRDQINKIRSQLPDGIKEIRIKTLGTGLVSFLQLNLVSNTASYKKLKEEADRIKKDIERFSGVKKVEILAIPKEELRIALNPIKMKEINVSLMDVENAIRSNNANIPGGVIQVANKVYNISTSGSYSNIEQIKNTVVGTYDDKLVYLKNIASIYFDYADQKWMARYNGKKAIHLLCRQKEGTNIFSVVDPIKSYLKKLELPSNIEMVTAYDQSKAVAENTQAFINNLLQGIFLVGLIILLVLGLRSSALVIIAIPLSIIIGLWGVSLLGYALHQMTIAGLIVALGLLVDNSI